MNAALLQELSQLQEISELLGNVYREKAYRRGLAELRKLKFEITRENLAEFMKMKILNVGEGIKGKISEFITTGTIAEIDELKRSREYTAYRDFSGIAGVGPSTIKSWVDKKIYTLSGLRQAVARGKIELNRMQKYGLMYYSDLNERIPRSEVTALGEYIKRLLIQIDPAVIFTIAGSYRRGTANSGDIDILVSNRERFNGELLPQVVQLLDTDPAFVDTLSNGPERVTFLYKSPISGKVRQIDILNLPYGSYWSGVLYFTGSYDFNEAMRGYAKKQGYRLNQNGLYRVGKRGRLELLPSHSEEEIFRLLGLKYVPPGERNGPKVIPL